MRAVRNPGLDGRLRIIRWGLFAAFLLYVSIRVFSVPLTNDEFGALLSVYRGSLADLITFRIVDAQNHPLAAFCAILLRRFLPLGEIAAVRLPAVFGFLCFGLGALRATARLNHPWLQVLGLAALLTNAFALDFFSLARGYGLALGFQMLSLAFLIDLVCTRERPSHSSLRTQLALWCGCLAVISHLAFLSYFVGLIAMLFLLGFSLRGALRESLRGGAACDSPDLPPKKVWLSTVFHEVGRQGYLLVCGALLAVFYLPIVIKLVAGDKLYFGGTRGWVADSVSSLIDATFYRLDAPASVVTGLAYGLVILGCLLGARQLVGFRAWRDLARLRPAGVCFFLLAVMALFAYGLHLGFEVRFVLERAALILLPPAVCLFLFATDDLSGRFQEVLFLLLTVYVLVGASQLNLRRTLSWEMTADAPQLVADLAALREAQGGGPLVLGISDSCKTTTWYYLNELLSKEKEPKLTDKGLVRITDWLALYPINLQPVVNTSIKVPTASEAERAGFQYWLPVDPREGGDSGEERVWLHRDTDYLLVRDGHGLDQYPWPAEKVKDYIESRTTLLRLRWPTGGLTG
ncbi:MAG: hypothetical protein K0U98_12430 [Deltaproteobacteria bacterium]|nr:hypothetical protein [Deltaproteobacteria bacterium]